MRAATTEDDYDRTALQFQERQQREQLVLGRDGAAGAREPYLHFYFSWFPPTACGPLHGEWWRPHQDAPSFTEEAFILLILLPSLAPLSCSRGMGGQSLVNVFIMPYAWLVLPASLHSRDRNRVLDSYILQKFVLFSFFMTSWVRLGGLERFCQTHLVARWSCL
jgi:hypothetical protein